jgi:type IV secretion system protein VirB1
MLAMATVLSLAAQCGSGVAPDTIASIAQAESSLDPLVIHDNTVQRTFQSGNLPEAIALATDLIVAQHHSADLGLMQVNSANLATLGLSITDAFDACRSIEAGGRLLSEVYQRALRGALSAYNTGDLQRGISNGYVGRVEHAALSVPSIAPGAPAPPAQTRASPPASAAAGWDVFAQSGGSPFVFTGK